MDRDPSQYRSYCPEVSSFSFKTQRRAQDFEEGAVLRKKAMEKKEKRDDWYWSSPFDLNGLRCVMCFVNPEHGDMYCCEEGHLLCLCHGKRETCPGTFGKCGARITPHMVSTSEIMTALSNRKESNEEESKEDEEYEEEPKDDSEEDSHTESQDTESQDDLVENVAIDATTNDDSDSQYFTEDENDTDTPTKYTEQSQKKFRFVMTQRAQVRRELIRKKAKKQHEDIPKQKVKEIAPESVPLPPTPDLESLGAAALPPPPPIDFTIYSKIFGRSLGIPPPPTTDWEFLRAALPPELLGAAALPESPPPPPTDTDYLTTFGRGRGKTRSKVPEARQSNSSVVPVAPIVPAGFDWGPPIDPTRKYPKKKPYNKDERMLPENNYGYDGTTLEELISSYVLDDEDVVVYNRNRARIDANPQAWIQTFRRGRTRIPDEPILRELKRIKDRYAIGKKYHQYLDDDDRYY